METIARLTKERAGRNAAGTGSRPRLRQDGLWCVHLSCGSATNERGDAVRVRRSVYGRTAEEVEWKAAALRAALAAGASAPDQVTTVADLLARWLARKRACACTGSYTVDTSLGGGEGAVLAAAMTATTRSPPAALDGHESGPYRVAWTTHHERRPGCPSGQ